MQECKHTRELCRDLEAMGAMTYPMVGSGTIYNARGAIIAAVPPGWPDRFVAHILWQGFLEFKEGRNQLDPLQRRMIEWLRSRGMNAWVVRFPWPVKVEDPGRNVVAECAHPRELLEDLAELSR